MHYWIILIETTWKCRYKQDQAETEVQFICLNTVYGSLKLIVSLQKNINRCKTTKLIFTKSVIKHSSFFIVSLLITHPSPGVMAPSFNAQAETENSFQNGKEICWYAYKWCFHISLINLCVCWMGYPSQFKLTATSSALSFLLFAQTCWGKLSYNCRCNETLVGRG